MKKLMENWRDYEGEVISEAAATATAVGALAPGAVEAALGAMAAEAGAVSSAVGTVAAPIVVGTAAGAAGAIEAISRTTGMSRKSVLDRAIIGAKAVTDSLFGGNRAEEYWKSVTSQDLSAAAMQAAPLALSLSPEQIGEMYGPDLPTNIEDSAMSDADYAAAINAALRPGGAYNPEPPRPPKKPMSKAIAIGTGIAGLGAATGGLYYKSVKDEEAEKELESRGLGAKEFDQSLEDVAAGGSGGESSNLQIPEKSTEEKEADREEEAADLFGTPGKVKSVREDLAHQKKNVKEVVREEVIKFFSNRRKN